jgi:nucleotide-binding universal stress UspA family protein
MAYQRILVPVDGSATSYRGLTEAIKLARRLKARLKLLYVVEAFSAFSSAEVAIDVEPLLEALRRSGRKALAAIEQRARRAGARPEIALAENFGMRVSDSIVEQAKRWRADLIVMGTHGRRGLQRALLGSDAELVVRYSPMPVLLVPASKRPSRR